MKRLLLAGLVLVVTLGLGLLWIGTRIVAGVSAPAGAPLAAPPPPVVEQEARLVVADAPVRDEVEVAEEPEQVEPAVEVALAPPETVADLEAVQPIEIRVVDEREQPVRDAEVVIGGMRSVSSAGSWYGYRGGEKPTASTDRDGRVRLEHWVWVDQDGRTRAIDLNVTHPDFITFRDSSFEIGPGEHTVVLRRGPTVVVAAWIHSRGSLVKDVTLQVDRDARVAPDAWRPEPDGRWSTDRIPPGPHFLLVEHQSEEHGVCFSEVTPFELEADGYVVIEVELLPAERLDGVLEPNVPRPIVDGHVLLVMQHGETGYQKPTIHRKFETTVDAEGAFTFEGLPRGRGQLFASCAGWVSRRTLADSPEDAGIHGIDPRSSQEERAALLEGFGDRAFQPQRVRIPGERHTVLMEQAGSVEVRVELESGTPLQGAVASAAPNVQFIGVGSSIVPWREWHAVTDSNGVALIEELPPDESLWLHARHGDYQMTKEQRLKAPSVRIVAGETTRTRIVLVPK